MAVIVTDGRPQDDVAEVVAEARERGFEIYVVLYQQKLHDRILHQ